MFGLVLAACNKDDDKELGNQTRQTEVTKKRMKRKKKQQMSGPKKGGTVTGAMHTAPAGMFNPIFYEEAYEANIIDFTHEGLTHKMKN